MNILRLIAKILILIVGFMMLLLSVDVFELEGTILELIGAFFIHAMPAIIILLILVVFWRRERILGFLAIVAAVTLFIVFEFYTNLEQNWMTILILIVPLVIAGVILMLKREQ